MVTITAITSTIYGLPLTSGNLLLTTSGNWASLTADAANNYLAYGFVGSGGGGGGGTFFALQGGAFFGVQGGQSFGVQ